MTDAPGEDCIRPARGRGFYSVSRNRNTRLTHARNLVAQGARANTQFVRSELATAAALLKCAEDQSPLMILKIGTELFSFVTTGLAERRAFT